MKNCNYKWWLGLLIVILTAIASYVGTSCTVQRNVKLNIDSLQVQKVNLETEFNTDKY